MEIRGGINNGLGTGINGGLGSGMGGMGDTWRQDTLRLRRRLPRSTYPASRASPAGKGTSMAIATAIAAIEMRILP